jgi:hypothetical protein
MSFLDLQRALRENRLDPFLAYAGRYDDLRGPHLDAFGRTPPLRDTATARGAWNLVLPGDGTYVVTSREHARPSHLAPDTSGPEPVVCDDEAQACDEIYAQVYLASRRERVVALGPGDVPPVLAGWLESCGWSPAASLFGNPFVATRGDQSFRVAVRAGRHELHLHDHLVPAVRSPLVGSVDPVDVWRVLLAEVGDRSAPRPLGWPRARWRREAGVSVLGGLSLEALRDAYLTERPDGPVVVGAEGVDLSLVSDEIVSLAERAGLHLQPFSDAGTAELDGGYTGVRYVVRRNEGSPRFTLLHHGERQTVGSVVAASDDLREVQDRLVQALGG